ncbi:MAG: glyoxalase [Bacteroidetes bacterium]|nr:MAG: glyoxalase [Bacteroidota bacterium]
MNHHAKSIRTFIGARNFDISRRFYQALGFEEVIISKNMSLFRTGDLGFYLQDAYVKDWVNNTMIFLEVANVQEHHSKVMNLELTKAFPGVRISAIKLNDWGKEYFVHDPSGILWHFGSFNQI